jgi:hypothetical protein
MLLRIGTAGSGHLRWLTKEMKRGSTPQERAAVKTNPRLDSFFAITKNPHRNEARAYYKVVLWTKMERCLLFADLDPSSQRRKKSCTASVIQAR